MVLQNHNLDTEVIVLCDELGTATGTAPKLASHHADTPLHLAFSCYVFNDKGELLITQRAHSKKVWPDVWTNSVCGHPMPGESMTDAIRRRLDYELGMQAKDLQVVLPQYRYVTPPYDGITENEFCPVFAARMSSDPRPNDDEVQDYKWMPWQDFITYTSQDSDDYSATNGSLKPRYSWWCKDQLKQLIAQPIITDYVSPIS